MKKVFICSPFAATPISTIDENVKLATTVCRFAVSMGLAPYAPHLYLPLILEDGNEIERQKGIKIGLSFLLLCDEMWVVGNYISKGMEQEIEYAKNVGIPIRKIKV